MQEYTASTEQLNFEKVWAMFQATDAKFQATDAKFQATDTKIKETTINVDKLTAKLDQSEKRWSKFVESLVEGKLIEMLRAKNIEVNRTYTRIKTNFNEKDYEFDIFAINGSEMVVVEVKTTLGIEDVNDFIEDMQDFKEVFPEYGTKKVIGAMAYINVDSAADRFAAKKGFYLIKATGESARIVNRESFKAKEW
ncbi:MAG: hypothetical protein NT007_03565 [Candidatus Kapabacteria bacterium]|nr:hypothetical protein [Candidatus Kapabacteria bacterium]